MLFTRFGRNPVRGLVLSVLCAAASCANAALNDVFPGDYKPNAEGVSTAKFHLFERNLEGPYVNGARKSNVEVHNNAGALQLNHFTRLGDYTFTPVAVLAWGRSETTPSGPAAKGASASGFGDLRLGGTVWLHNDRIRHEYVALTAHVIAPTGSYDSNRHLNIGENRWKYILGAGWIKPLNKTLHMMLAPEIVFYGKNDQFNRGQTLEQSHSYALTGYLDFHVLPNLHLSLGGQINRGGETRLDGVDQNNPLNSTRYMLGAAYFPPGRKSLWALRYAHETSADNGFRLTDEIALRYGTAF